MNRRTSIAVDVLFVLACIFAALSVVSNFLFGIETSIHGAVWACFCLLMAVLLCVYPRGGAK